jgi:maleylacetate reductase
VLRFVYQTSPAKIVFRAGALEQLPAEVAALGKRALVLSTPGHRNLAELATALLGPAAVAIHDKARMHVPIEIAEGASAEALRCQADCLVAVGGGSTIGLAKAVALTLGLPIVAVPTTYSGSEMTPVWGVVENGVKRTSRDPRVVPRTVIYDPALTVSLPASVTAASGMNALAHCVEALYSEQANPLISLAAEEGIRALSRSLPKLVRAAHDIDARSMALYGAWLAGHALGTVGMALHHKLCHVLGGAFDLPHAQTHAVVLPHVVAYNAGAAQDAVRRVAVALNAHEAAQGLHDLRRSLDIENSLKELGMPADGIPRAVELATTDPYYNPAPIKADALRRLLENAFEGGRPQPYLI